MGKHGTAWVLGYFFGLSFFGVMGRFFTDIFSRFHFGYTSGLLIHSFIVYIVLGACLCMHCGPGMTLGSGTGEHGLTHGFFVICRFGCFYRYTWASPRSALLLPVVLIHSLTVMRFVFHLASFIRRGSSWRMDHRFTSLLS